MMYAVYVFAVFGLLGLLWLGFSLLREYAPFSKKSGSRERSFAATIDALNRIARGDFGVFLKADDFGPYTKFVGSINQMAKELGSMETLRQDFAANISHEIQSPLTSISGYAALLENDELAPQLRKHYLEIIKTESERLSRLSANLLKLSSLDSGVAPLSVRAFRLDKQLQSAVILLDPQWAAKNITIEAELEKVTISADEALLSQVWINLLNNAVKFTAERGAIHIALKAVGEQAVCSVTDNGAGIAPEDLPHIFERFYKADKARDRSLGGNGLGLSLVKKIVELHGGEVTVDSKPGKGAVFMVTLPIG